MIDFLVRTVSFKEGNFLSNIPETNIKGILATPPKATPPRNKGWIFGLIKGNQWLINP